MLDLLPMSFATHDLSSTTTRFPVGKGARVDEPDVVLTAVLPEATLVLTVEAADEALELAVAVIALVANLVVPLVTLVEDLAVPLEVAVEEVATDETRVAVTVPLAEELAAFCWPETL
jgi:hypothetical protein